MYLERKKKKKIQYNIRRMIKKARIKGYTLVGQEIFVP